MLEWQVTSLRFVGPRARVSNQMPLQPHALPLGTSGRTLETRRAGDLDQYVQYMRSHGFYAAGFHALGGGLGTFARYGLNGLIAQRIAPFLLGLLAV